MPQAMTPGRPHEPTIHPRTKPEGVEYALRDRAMGDWFRHDGKNVERSTPPVPRTGSSRQAQENATKSRGDAAVWFKHDPNAPADPRPAPRCPSEEAKHAHEKVYGNLSVWFKHDDNRHYYEPCRDRLGVCGGEDIKKKFVSHDASRRTMNWYRHEHDPSTDDYQPDRPHCLTGPVPQSVLENSRKVYGVRDGPKTWFEHKWTPSSDNARPAPKVTMKEAMELWQKDRCGSSADWYEHDPTVTEAEPYCPRVSSKDGEEIARRLAFESKNSVWSSDSAPEPQVQKLGSAAVQEIRERANGSDMQRVMRHSGRGPPPAASLSLAVKPEAEGYATQNKVGSMKSVFNEAANRNFVDDYGGAPRIVRPEAQETFDKNKGGISDCFKGYRDQAVAKSIHKAPPSDPEIARKHTGSSMDKVIKGEGPPGSGRFHAARAVKPEAEDNARKHAGGAMTDVFMGGPEEFVARGPKVRSELAMEVAQKHRGSTANLIC